MFRFTIRDALWLTVVVGLAPVLPGCDDDESHKVRVVRRGAESVDQHAKEIEKATKE